MTSKITFTPMMCSCISVVNRKMWTRWSVCVYCVYWCIISLNEIKQAETELRQNRMYLDHYCAVSKNIRGIDCDCGWCIRLCIRLSFVWCMQSWSIFWHSIKFEIAYIQRCQKLLFSAAATACFSPFTAVSRPENFAPGIHHVLAGLLQLVASGTTSLWYQSSTICPDAAGHLFGGVSRYDSVEHVLRNKLHWLPIVQRLKFKFEVFRYKAINGLAPPYLKDFFVAVSHLYSESKPICSPWGLYHSIRDQEHYLSSTKLCSSRTYVMELTSFRNS